MANVNMGGVSCLLSVSHKVGSNYGTLLCFWAVICEPSITYNACTAWLVPRATHRYFVAQLLTCDLTSAKVDIKSRYCM